MATWKGIDVSSSQGKINWNLAKNFINFAIIRIGYIGNNEKFVKDSFYTFNIQQCEKHKIPYGLYVYCYATSPEAVKRDMNAVLYYLKNLKMTLPIYLDLEESRIAKTGKENILKISKQFCESVEKAGYMAGIYANLNWFKSYLTDKWYQTKSLWVAQYNTTCDYKGTKEMWQYSSTGKINGIRGRVDLDYIYRSPIIGDVNDDGKLDKKDKERILKAAAKQVKLTEHQKAKADVDRDGKITSQDALNIKE